jgi:WD40 repeat protein
MTTHVGESAKVWDSHTWELVWDLPGTEQRDGPWSNPMAFSPDGTKLAVRHGQVIQIWSFARRVLLQELNRVDVGCSAIQFSPDSERLLAGYDDSRFGVVVWDLVTGQPQQTFGARIRSLDVSPDGRTVLTGGSDGMIRTWDAATGREIQSIHYEGAGRWLHSVSFRSDGRGFGASSMEGGVRLYDQTGGPIHHEAGPRGMLVAYSRDGNHLACTLGSAIKLWDSNALEELATWFGHEGDVSGVAFSPDGRRMYSISEDGTAKQWSTLQSPSRVLLEGHRNSLREIALSPDGQRLASGSLDGTVRVWDTATGQELLTLKGHHEAVTAVDYSADGKMISSGENFVGVIHIWDATTGQLLRTLRQPSFAWWIRFSPDGQSFLTTSAEDGTINLWNVRSGEQLRTIQATKMLDGAAFSPDGTLIATCNQDESGLIQLWEVSTGLPIKTFQGANAVHRSTAFSPDGKFLAVGAQTPYATIWDLETGQVKLLGGSGGRIAAIAFSPDGTRLFGGGDGGSISIWDPRTGEQLWSFDSQQGTIWSIKVSRDGKTLATGGGDGTVALWRTESLPESLEEQRRLVRAAKRIVDANDSSGNMADQLIADIEQQANLEPALRQLAIRLAATRGDLPGRIFPPAQATLLDPGAAPEALALAARRIESVAAAWPHEPEALRLLALARIRSGLYQEALDLAQEAGNGTGGQNSAAAALLEAIALSRLGESQGARRLQAQAMPSLQNATGQEIGFLLELAAAEFGRE